jgi:hypothetical protein
MIGAVPPEQIHNIEVELDGPRTPEEIKRFNEEVERLVRSYGGRLVLKRRQIRSPGPKSPKE